MNNSGLVDLDKMLELINELTDNGYYVEFRKGYEGLEMKVIEIDNNNHTTHNNIIKLDRMNIDKLNVTQLVNIIKSNINELK